MSLNNGGTKNKPLRITDEHGDLIPRQPSYSRGPVAREKMGEPSKPIERTKGLNPVGAAKRRRTPAERAAKEAARERDGSTCQRCGAFAREVHHLLTVGAHIELEMDLANLLTLCPRCHRTGKDSAHGDPAAFNRWAADEFPRFAPLYARYGKGDGGATVKTTEGPQHG